MGLRVAPDLEERILRQAGLLPVAPPADDCQDEKEFSAQFQEYFEGQGWEGFHTFDSRRSKCGYPDWTLVRERVVWVELKTEAGRLTASQECWRDWIREAGGEWHCFRPCDWPEIERVLGGQPQ